MALVSALKPYLKKYFGQGYGVVWVSLRLQAFDACDFVLQWRFWRVP